ncbi:MAG: hypothetical protein AAGD35_22570 [Actinomycetota bacterium]
MAVAETDAATSGSRSPLPVDAPTVDDAQQGFSQSILISGIRCLLAYVVLPFFTPIIGLAPGVGPVIGLVVGTVAIVANVFSIRRFWKADHHWKKQVTVLHVSVIVLLLVLLFLDLRQLLG